MISRRISLALVATAALASTAFQPCVAQTAQSLEPRSAAPLAASASTAVPALVPFSGLTTAPDGKPLTGETTITFLIFKDQEGGEPLFAETQSVTPDSSGHYRSSLGQPSPTAFPQSSLLPGKPVGLKSKSPDRCPSRGY